MKPSVIGIIALLTLGVLTGPAPAEAILEWRALDATAPSQRPAIIRTLSDEEKKEMIATIKRESTMFKNLRNASDLLVQLDDDETITSLGNMVASHNDEGNTALEILLHTPQIKTIAALAPLIGDEELEYRHLLSFNLIRNIIKTPGFDPSVYRWAEGMTHHDSDFSIEIMREWWKANAVHFEKEDYKAVRPGAAPPPEGSYEWYQTSDGAYHVRLLPSFAGWTPTPPVETPAPNPGSPSTPRTKSNQESQTEGVRNGNHALLVFALLVIAAGIAIYFKRRKHS